MPLAPWHIKGGILHRGVRMGHRCPLRHSLSLHLQAVLSPDERISDDPLGRPQQDPHDKRGATGLLPRSLCQTSGAPCSRALLSLSAGRRLGPRCATRSGTGAELCSRCTLKAHLGWRSRASPPAGGALSGLLPNGQARLLQKVVPLDELSDLAGRAAWQRNLTRGAARRRVASPWLMSRGTICQNPAVV